MNWTSYKIPLSNAEISSSKRASPLNVENRKHIGQKVAADSDKTWDQVISSSFDELEKDGLSNPEFARIRALLKTPVDSYRAAEAAMKAKQWPQAIERLKATVDLFKHQIQNEQYGDVMAAIYIALSWCQLHTRDFEGAIASSQAGLKIQPDNLVLQTNHAHALLFLGRTAEAEEIYRKYIGQKIKPDSEKTWEQTILDDFDEFQKAGITHPDFDRIRGILKSPQH